MKYINQLDYPDWLYITRTAMEGEAMEKGKTTTVKSSGCGLCSAIMVADRLLPNCEFGLKEALRLSYDVEANWKTGTSYARFAPAFAEKMGLKLEATKDPEKLRHCLRTGGAAVVLVDGDHDGRIGVFSHIGHYITAINEEPDGRIALLDPSYKEGKFEEEGRVGKVEMKNGCIAVCEMQVLIDDTARRQTPFYLFWRA